MSPVFTVLPGWSPLGTICRSHCCVSTSSFTPRIQGRLQRQTLNSAGSFQLGRNFKEFHSLYPVSLETLETICRNNFSYPQLADMIARYDKSTLKSHAGCCTAGQRDWSHPVMRTNVPSLAPTFRHHGYETKPEHRQWRQNPEDEIGLRSFVSSLACS